MRTIMTVVLQNKTYQASQTLNCLIGTYNLNTDLLIINNGPKAITFDKNFIHTLGFYVKSINIKAFLDERPLSWIYNGVINEFNAYDRFIFFDDDVLLDSNHLAKLDAYYAEDVDVQIPNIKDIISKKIHYPRINKETQKIPNGTKINAQYSLISINSGLVIYRGLIDKFSDHNMEVFDNRFAIYGVDYNFFNRLAILKRANYDICIQIVNTIESLAKTIANSDSVSQEEERLYDRVLSGKYYSRNKFILCCRMTKISLNQLVRFKFSNINLIIKTFAKGKHPRC